MACTTHSVLGLCTSLYKVPPTQFTPCFPCYNIEQKAVLCPPHLPVIFPLLEWQRMTRKRYKTQDHPKKVSSSGLLFSQCVPVFFSCPLSYALSPLHSPPSLMLFTQLNSLGLVLPILLPWLFSTQWVVV